MERSASACCSSESIFCSCLCCCCIHCNCALVSSDSEKPRDGACAWNLRLHPWAAHHSCRSFRTHQAQRARLWCNHIRSGNLVLCCRYSALAHEEHRFANFSLIFSRFACSRAQSNFRRNFNPFNCGFRLTQSHDCELREKLFLKCTPHFFIASDPISQLKGVFCL